jgi:hypothetical protein
MFLFNARLSILGMVDASAFVIKGDAHTFMMGEGMRDVSAFKIKGDAPIETRASFPFIIKDAY